MDKFKEGFAFARLFNFNSMRCDQLSILSIWIGSKTSDQLATKKLTWKRRRRSTLHCDLFKTNYISWKTSRMEWFVALDNIRNSCGTLFSRKWVKKNGLKLCSSWVYRLLDRPWAIMSVVSEWEQWTIDRPRTLHVNDQEKVGFLKQQILDHLWLWITCDSERLNPGVPT